MPMLTSSGRHLFVIVLTLFVFGSGTVAESQSLSTAVSIESIKPLRHDEVTTIVHVLHTVFLPASASRDAVQWRILDESLMPTTGDDAADAVTELKLMAAHGIDAIMFRAHPEAVQFYFDAIAASKTDIKLAPLYTAGALAIRGTDVAGWQGFYKKIKAFCDKWYHNPHLYRENGVPIIYIYRAESKILSPEGFRQLREALAKDGYRVNLLGMFQPQPLQRHRDPVAYLRPYAQQMGFFTWATPTELKVANQEIYLKALKGLRPRDHYHATVSPGKWRPEQAQWYPQHGTRTFRTQIQLALDADPNAIVFESWDDLSELECIEPTVENDGSLLELMAFLLSDKGVTPTSKPRLILSYPREVLRGRVLNVEVLALPCDHDQKLSMRLEDERGRELRTFEPQDIATGSCAAYTFSLPTSELDQVRAVFPVVTVHGKAGEHTYRGAGYIRIRTGRLQNQYTRHVSLDELATVPHLSLQINNTGPGGELSLDPGEPMHVKIDVTSAQPLRRVDLIRDSMFPVHAWEPGTPTDDGETKCLAMTWNTAAPGYKQPYDFNGSLAIQGGGILQGFLGKSSVSQSPYIMPDANGRLRWSDTSSNNRVSVKFHMNSAAMFTLNFPAYHKHWTFSWKELTSHPFIEHQLSDHSLVKIQRLEGPFGLPQPLNQKHVSGECLVDDSSHAAPVNAYSLRLIDMDGRIYRSRPVWVRRSDQTAPVPDQIWCEDTKQIRTVSLPQYEIGDSRWLMKEGGGRFAFCSGLSYGRRHWESGGWGYAAELGGTALRAGGFAAAGVPTWIKSDSGSALQFDGDDRLYIPPGAVPIGAMTLEMRIKPQLPHKEALLFDGLPLYRIWLEANGRLRVEYQFDSKGRHETLRSDASLKADQWGRLALVNDLTSLTIYINGKPSGSKHLVGEPPLRLSKRIVVGARQRNLDRFDSGYQGLIGGMRLTCQALPPSQFLMLR